jgi:hypothetical protein
MTSKVTSLSFDGRDIIEHLSCGHVIKTCSFGLNPNKEPWTYIKWHGKSPNSIGCSILEFKKRNYAECPLCETIKNST